MSSPETLGILHPGRMGTALAGQALRSGHEVLWCPPGRGADTRERAMRAGLSPVASLSELVRRAQIIVSVCPPAAAEDVATAVMDQGYTGIYVDANAISPVRLLALRHGLTAGGAVVLDGAVFGPPPAPADATAAPGRGTTLYLSGPSPAVSTVAAIFEGGRLRVVAMEQPPPAASALKIAHTSYQKATRALAAVAHALAERYGVTDQLLAEADANSVSPLADPESLPGVAARAWRWVPELRDAAVALQDAALPGDMARAAADVLQRWQGHKDDWHAPLPELLEELHDDHAGSPP